MPPEGLGTGVDVRLGGAWSKAEADHPGGHPLGELQGGNDMAGLALVAGGPGGDADALGSQVVDDVLAGPARQGDGQDMGGRPRPHGNHVRDIEQFLPGVGAIWAVASVPARRPRSWPPPASRGRGFFTRGPMYRAPAPLGPPILWAETVTKSAPRALAEKVPRP